MKLDTYDWSNNFQRTWVYELLIGQPSSFKLNMKGLKNFIAVYKR